MKSKLWSVSPGLFLSLMLLVLNAAPTSAQSRFRVTLTGFRVNHQTTENVASIDGAGDEVFALVNFAEIWSPNSLFGALQRKQSLIYGDTNGRIDPVNPTRILPELSHPGSFGTVQAGSASPTGGLRTNDVFPPPSGPVLRPGASEAARARMIPMILWEGELRSGPRPNAVVLIPTIWENDNVPDVLNIWNRQVDAWIRHFAASGRIFNSRQPFVEQVETVLSTIPQRNDFDRPIGMGGEAFNPGTASPAPATFIPAIMSLTLDSAQNIVTQNHGKADVTYQDGQSYGGGSYTLFILVERLS